MVLYPWRNTETPYLILVSAGTAVCNSPDATLFTSISKFKTYGREYKDKKTNGLIGTV